MDDAPRPGVRAEPSTLPDDSLAVYRQCKLGLAQTVMTAMNVARARHDDERVEEARALLARLAEDCFYLAVVGQFSRGKSTLMNAILGRPYLPTGSLPMTSVITTVAYGSRPEVLVRRRHGRVPIQVSLDDLTRYVTQHGSDRADQQVESAEVKVPAEILRLGFFFVDTPGVGSAITENSSTTERFLPEADAVVFVTSFDSPLTDSEASFLAQVRQHVQKVFVVVNKADLVSADEAEWATAFVVDHLRHLLGANIRVFPLSARRGLQGKREGDEAEVAASGLPALEQALVSFLTNEKSAEFLVRAADRARRFVARLRDDVLLGLASNGELAVRLALEDAVRRHQHEQAGLVRDFQRRSADAVAEALEERQVCWPEELRANLLPDRDSCFEATVASAATAARALRAGQSAIEEMASRALGPWLEARAAHLSRVLEGATGDLRLALAQLPAALEVSFMNALSVKRDADGGGPAPRPLEIPALRPREISVSVPRQSLWWGRLARPPWARRRLERAFEEALEEVVEGACDQAGAVLERSAAIAVDQLAERAKADLVQSAQLLQGRASAGANGEHLATLETLSSRLDDLLEGLITGPDAESRAMAATAAAASPGTARSPGPVEGPVCLVCDRLAPALFDFLAKSQLEVLVGEGRRVAPSAAGLCPLHAWDQVEIGSPVSVSVGYAGVGEATARLLDEAASAPDSCEGLAGRVAELIAVWERCPACLVLEEAERQAVAEILGTLDPEDPDTVPGLCLGHLARVLDAGVPPVAARLLVEEVARELRRGAEDMRTFSLKRESLRADLVTTEEARAHREVTARLAGHPLLATRWRTDSPVASPYQLARQRLPRATPRPQTPSRIDPCGRGT
jgi:Dynamin family